jgi:hypothetical protein
MRAAIAGWLAAALVALAASPVGAADNGSVTGTVTVAQGGACLVVGASTVDFGTNPFSSLTTGSPVYEGTYDGGSSNRLQLQNCGAVDETVLVRGTNATSASSSTTWTLTPYGPCSMPPNYYGLFAVWDTTSGTDNINISTGDAELSSGAIPAGGSLSSGNWIMMPCEGSDGAGESFELAIYYTAVTV